MSELGPIQCERRGMFLVPCAPTDSDALMRFPTGKTLSVRVTQSRSSRQLRLYRAMLSLVAENLEQDVTADDLHEWLKLRLGYVREVRQRNGEVVHVAKSVAFAKMDQPTFREFFDKAVTMLIEHIIPGLDSADLEREARAMLGEAA